MKTIKVTYIDTAGHGYYSVSKKDFVKVCDPKDITGCSGHNYTRMYLEEDCDGSLFFEKAKEKGYVIVIKNSYNPKFDFGYGYKPELFNYKPQIGQTIDCHGRCYKIVGLIKNKTIIMTDVISGQKFKINGRKPFDYITKLV